MTGERFYRVIFGGGVGFAVADVTATDPVMAVCAAVNQLCRTLTVSESRMIRFIRDGLVRVRPIREEQFHAEHSDSQPW